MKHLYFSNMTHVFWAIHYCNRFAEKILKTSSCFDEVGLSSESV